jgi:endogenous inhibitor of DNA gyrase (YacG/DUF329 family)
MSKTIKKCEHCGIEFEAKTNNAKLCSSKCRWNSWSKKNSEKLKAHRTKFNLKCREKTANKTPKTIKCEHCGIETEVRRNTKRFCSGRCQARTQDLNNPEKRKTKRKLYYESHRDECLTWSKEYRLKNPEIARKANTKFRENNREKYRAAIKRYYDKNPEKNRAKSRKSTYKKLGYPDELLEIKELQYQLKKEIKNQSKS